MGPLDGLGSGSQEPRRAPVPVPPDVLGAALVTAAQGAAAVVVHGVLEHGAPLHDAARPPDLFAPVLAWAWRWDQTSALQLLAVYLDALRVALDDPLETAPRRASASSTRWRLWRAP